MFGKKGNLQLHCSFQPYSTYRIKGLAVANFPLLLIKAKKNEKDIPFLIVTASTNCMKQYA